MSSSWVAKTLYLEIGPSQDEGTIHGTPYTPVLPGSPERDVGSGWGRGRTTRTLTGWESLRNTKSSQNSVLSHSDLRLTEVFTGNKHRWPLGSSGKGGEGRGVPLEIRKNRYLWFLFHDTDRREEKRSVGWTVRPKRVETNLREEVLRSGYVSTFDNRLIIFFLCFVFFSCVRKS